MKISAAYPSKYLKAADLQDREHKMIIAKVELEPIGDDDHKPVVYFTKAKKGLVCNKTNAKAIAAAYGDDTDEWTGKEIVLFPMMVQFRDDMVESRSASKSQKLPSRQRRRPRRMMNLIRRTAIWTTQYLSDEQTSHGPRHRRHGKHGSAMGRGCRYCELAAHSRPHDRRQAVQFGTGGTGALAAH